MSNVFDIETLHAIAQQGVGKVHNEMVSIVVEEAARAYPAHIDPSPSRRWTKPLTQQKKPLPLKL